MRSRIFAMVSMGVSKRYTKEALRSFFTVTDLVPEDRFVLIDNDGSGADLPGPWERCERLVPTQPCSFSQNVNSMLTLARERQADLFFLNNDLFFTPGWLEPLLEPRGTIVTPLSNRELHETSGALELKTTMTLEDLRGKEEDLVQFSHTLKDGPGGILPVVVLAFYCVRLPYEVYSVVGDFDEGFARGGGEDSDYCIRAQLAGFNIGYARQSFVLHFNGKSTWAGAETKAESERRCNQFRDTFVSKWGEDLATLFLGYNDAPLRRCPEAMQLVSQGRLPEAVAAMVRKQRGMF